ncbi:pilin [Candidatus Symbiobacter mobilis]|uniref:Fimbrial protein n=1 Tax=Candidatus Symbiobacter mobilis CR TaxID=946483 RepID=U5N7Q6_9BURK|nr:pilin [Candidatus Symbiobacter mobilis]AGX87576.1 fimbrial protein [Candidatus Symbiobacter mobilis CR]
MKSWWTGPRAWALGAASVLVVALLVTVFLLRPAYQDQQSQSLLADVFPSVAACRADVARVVQTTTAPVLSPSLFSCDGGISTGVRISKHLKSIAVNQAGVITVTLHHRTLPELSPTTNTLTVVPLTAKGHPLQPGDVRQKIASWRCGSRADGTTIPAKLLPADCKG